MNWFKSLFKDPKTTSAGILALAITGVKCYAMATGKAPVDVNSVTTSLSAFSAGVGLLTASDAKVSAGANTVAEAAVTVAPVAQKIQETIEAKGEEAKMQKIVELTEQVNAVLAEPTT